MGTHFDLIITADYPSRTAEFTLRDSAGVQLAFHQTDFKTISISHQQGLFDLRNYLRLYIEEGKERAAVTEIGVCIAEEVLGAEIFAKLWESQSQRTLRIQLPGADDTENHLPAALARVPWEIARPKADADTLGERNLLVRVVHDMKAPASVPIELAADEPLRVLFVFAEARGSRPLGARKERRELLQLFEKEIYPQRRIVAHFLTHGVTRERLEAQIQENGGYHVVHWSGHGHRNVLELARPGGARNRISGSGLLDIFNQSGAVLPKLVFLSACHSGDILAVKVWDDFLAIASGKEPQPNEAEKAPLDFSKLRSFTGTSHMLLQGGVPSVVAMRYAVGDEYAREMAVEFYRALFNQPQTMNVAAALTLARQSMLDDKKHAGTRFAVCDHATPVLYGEEQPGLPQVNGRSPDLNPRNPRLHQIAELTTAGHEHFVGRTWELVGLGANFIGSSKGTEVNPVAVITGLGGMGKTALAAEALALWESRFEWVLLYQAKPNRLEFDSTLSDIHIRLMGELKLYYDHVRANPADAIYRDADWASSFTGSARLQRLSRNLVRALKDEPILIVLDNFESNLKDSDPAPEFFACQDPAWDDCLALLAKELIGSPSRMLITCRRPLAALEGGASHCVRLGPLPSSEAALYLKEQPALGRMVFGGDKAEKALATRLLSASRFHPLLMDRLAKLAAQESPRTHLLEALDALEKTKDFAQLPALFTVESGDTTELSYLEDALAASIDEMIQQATPNARTLLWIIALANEPVRLRVLDSIWSSRTELEPLLRQIIGLGLVTQEWSATMEGCRPLACHELVRARIRIWMRVHSDDRCNMSEKAVWREYAEQLKDDFEEMKTQDVSSAIRSGICAIVYYVQSDAWDRLGAFADDVITSTRDPILLGQLIPHLQSALDSDQENVDRRKCIHSLANTLRNSGRPEDSLPFYEQAASLARAVAEADCDASHQAWIDLSKISSGWAIALRRVGKNHAARQRYVESTQAAKKASRPTVHIVSNELEMLRLDIIQGSPAASLPEIIDRLLLIKAWWNRHLRGEIVPEAPDADFLARALIGALDVEVLAHKERGDWESALRALEETLTIREYLKHSDFEIAIDRFNRANTLIHIPVRFGEAKKELEDCLQIFQSRIDWIAKIRCCFADLFATHGDVVEAIDQQRRALAICNQLTDPSDRGHSHESLARYLKRLGNTSDVLEVSQHQLAAFIYFTASGLEHRRQPLLDSYRNDHGPSDVTKSIPSLPELLDNPAFAPLEQWLRQREVDLDGLQSAVDQLLNQARQAATPP